MKVMNKITSVVLSSAMALGLAGVAQAQSAQQIPTHQPSQSHQSMGESKSKAQEKASHQMKKSKAQEKASHQMKKSKAQKS